MARFVGKLDFAPQTPEHPKEWMLSQDFGFVRNDGLLVIAQAGGRVDGASIPRFMWRLVGHPFWRRNRFWSVPHDAGYGGWAIIIATKRLRVTPEIALTVWRELEDTSVFIHASDLPRKWWDDTLRQAMVALRERWWKRCVVYRAVRMFGKSAYRKKC